MNGSKDSEFIKFRNNILVVFLITGICIIFVILFFGKGLVGGPVTSKMKDKDSFLIFINNEECSNCNEIKTFLDNKNVSYEELNEYNSEAKKIFKKYDFIVDESISPAVIYVKNGKVYSSLVNLVDTEELGLFIENYKLSK